MHRAEALPAPISLSPPACPPQDAPRPLSDRQAIVAELNSRLQHLQQAARRTLGPARGTGVPQLDALLPEGGLPPGALVELLGEPGNGAVSLALRLAAGMAVPGAVVVVDPHGWFYPPAAVSCGCDPRRLIVLRPGSAVNALWACEQVLRCRGVGSSLAWLDRLEGRAVRRLQLACETGGGVGFLLRPAAVAGQPRWADVRLQVESLASSSQERRLRIVVLPQRGKRSGGAIEVEFRHDAPHVRVVSPLVLAASAARATGA
jgi:protein ImuA